ncbi:MAG: hypothetical protein IKL91_00035 [Bacteroidales bacterium]|nr:hypothetical protein [Bacteroidales bacterium]
MPLRKKAKDAGAEKGDSQADLLKLKKKDLLEIMLRQSEEIDELRAQIADLQAKLDDRDFQFDRIGSIAEASLAVTNIFQEAEKAAKLYLENIRSKVNEQGRG